MRTNSQPFLRTSLAPREMESEVLDARTRRLQEKHRVMIVVGRRTHEAARAGEVVGDAKAEA